jgi:hypothetical protein
MKPATKFAQLTLTCLLLLTACQGQPPQSAPVTRAAPAPTATLQPPTSIPTAAPEVQGQLAMQHLLALAQDIGARPPGSRQEVAAAQYIQTAFEEMGYSPEVQVFGFEDEDGNELVSQNVIAVKTGLSSKTLVVGAHYDSGDEADGVDDNASGVAVMLEAAERVAQVETPYTVIFIAFGAEENDLDGSYYYVEQMSRSDIKNTVAMINLDSLVAGDLAYVYGTGALRDWLLETAPQAGFELKGKTAADLENEDGSPCECADYGAFEEAKIPFAYFEATNWNLGKKDGMTQVDPALGDDGKIRHTEYDTIADINELFPGRIAEKLNLFTTLLMRALTDFQLER